MKQLTIIFLSCVLSISLLSAKEKSNSNTSVQHLINKVKNSTGDQRRVAMNSLKVHLRSMNQQTRQRVMLDLRKSFATTKHSRQRTMKNRKRTMNTNNAGHTESTQPYRGTYTNPSQTTNHYAPTTVPHNPEPSMPHMPSQPSYTAPQPSTPQWNVPSTPSPYYQPGEHH